MRFNNVLRNVYFGIRIYDIMTRRRGYRQRGTGLVHKPLTDKQIERNYTKAMHPVKARWGRSRRGWHRHHYNRQNGQIVGVAILLMLVLFALLTIIVSIPALH